MTLTRYGNAHEGPRGYVCVGGVLPGHQRLAGDGLADRGRPWEGIVEIQVTCLRNGINKVGIPDLIVAQQVMHCNLSLFTMDKHFRLMSRHMPLTIQ